MNKHMKLSGVVHVSEEDARKCAADPIRFLHERLFSETGHMVLDAAYQSMSDDEQKRSKELIRGIYELAKPFHNGALVSVAAAVLVTAVSKSLTFGELTENGIELIDRKKLTKPPTNGVNLN